MVRRFLITLVFLNAVVCLQTRTHFASTNNTAYENGLVSLEISLINSMGGALADLNSVTASVQSSGSISATEVNTTEAYVTN
jgi:hypothetical protein